MRSVHILASLPTVPPFLASHLLLRSTTGMLFYNSMLSLPMLFGAVIVKGELTHMAEYPLLWHRTFQLVLLASSALGLTINHSTFVCTRINEPLMTSVAGALAQRQCRGCVMHARCCCTWQGYAAQDLIQWLHCAFPHPACLCCTKPGRLTPSSHPTCPPAGNLKNAIMTIVGAFAFGDFIFEPWNAAGLTVSMLGAVWYAMRSALRVRGTQQGSICSWSCTQLPWLVDHACVGAGIGLGGAPYAGA